MTFVGMKVSKPGIDVMTAENKDCVLNSDLACLKVVESGKYDFTLANGASSTYTIPLTIGTTPMFVLVYVQRADGTYKPASPTSMSNYWSDYLNTYYEFTTSNLYVTIYNGTGSSVSRHFYYFICYA